MSLLPMLNPPRKAKRLRDIISKDTASPPPPPKSPQQPPSPTTPRPRGRKPAGPMSRAAREQLRKTNHSVIEKRRREKINEALAALRELVPNDKPDAEEKEFKLEVLVRTVEYLRMMVTKVRALEEQTCSKCGIPLTTAEKSTPGEKRKRLINEDVGEEQLSAAVQTSPSSRLQSPPSPPSLQLPSISTWLLSSPLHTPTFVPYHSSPQHSSQLPSPPQSAPFAPTHHPDFLPRLSLPPGIPIPVSPVRTHKVIPATSDRDVPDLALERPQQGFSQATPARPARDGPSSGPSGSPVSPWTRDDQTAASLLLNISSRSTADARQPSRLEAQTPSSVLGMAEGL